MNRTPATIPAAFVRFPLGAGPADLLEQAIGYSGEARFWATYWGAGDEAYYAGLGPDALKGMGLHKSDRDQS